MQLNCVSFFGSAVTCSGLALGGLLLVGATSKAGAQSPRLKITLLPQPALLTMGQTQTWKIELANTGAGDLFINVLSDGVDTPLALDDTTFQNDISTGMKVAAKQTFEEAFSITAPNNVPGLPGSGQQMAFQGYVTLMGGTTAMATDLLNSSSFVVNVAGAPAPDPVPEPGQVSAMAGMTIAAALLQRRRRRHLENRGPATTWMSTSSLPPPACRRDRPSSPPV